MSHAARSPINAGPRNAERVFDSLTEGVWERNLMTGEVWYSPRYKALLGLSEAELPNAMESMRARVHPDDLAGVEQALASATERLGASDCTARMLTRDGRWRWFRARVRVWPDELGRPELLVGAVADVHHEVVANESLKAHQAVLEQRVLERTQGLEAALLEAERANRAKASFLAHMSHELRTPLNGVLGMNELAQSLAVGREQRRYLELAQQSGRALLRILDDVLDFARVEAGRLQLQEDDVDLAQLAAETLRSFMPEVRAKGLEVGFDYVGDITWVRADAGRLRQIISNLIGNAIKFTDRGRVLLVVEVEPAEGGACQVRLSVSDSGIGMIESTAARVFEPFEQGDSSTNRRHGGTGLGLPIVRMLARMMDGDVSVRSRPGRGSEFRVQLRLAALGRQPLRALAEAGVAGGHAWVLVRNDSQDQNIRRRLERIGWSSELMPDVATAIDRVRDGHADPAPRCVVIAEDVLTPGTDLPSLRLALPPCVPMTLVLRPDFDLRTVRTVIDPRDLNVLIAPLVPADLHVLVRPARGSASAVARAPAPLPVTPAAKGFVLVVEDNPMNQIIAREMVAALGLTPIVVGSGEDALASCRCAPPDLVLMDIQMPGMDGLETTRRLRALQARGELRRFPIIALTAHAMASDRQASLDAGLDEHLTKPVQIDTLRRVLEHWLG